MVIYIIQYIVTTQIRDYSMYPERNGRFIKISQDISLFVRGGNRRVGVNTGVSDNFTGFTIS